MVCGGIEPTYPLGWSIPGTGWSHPVPPHPERVLVAERFEILRYFAEGDTVVALGYQRGHVRPNHTNYEFEFVHVRTLRDSKVTRFRVYYDTAYVASTLQGHPKA